MYPDPSRKHMAAYHDFSGGLNTETSNDNLNDNELTDLVNIDLGERGSLKRRNGFKRILEPETEGKGQGFFRYYSETGEEKELLLAVNGRLYRENFETGVAEPLDIAGLEDGFQTERFVEAVQMGNTLIIATGTDLVEYDGESAKVVEAYEPEPLEFLYVGTNALAEDPDSHIQDGLATFLRIDGVFPNKRYGVVNEETEFEVVVSKPEEAEIEYSYHYRLKGEEEWELGANYDVWNKFVFTPSSVGEYELSFLARVKDDPETEVEFYMPTYRVHEVEQEEEVDASSIRKCNRILLYWNQIILYGDPDNPQAIYISDINRYDYFPTPNSLEFQNRRNHPLTDVVRFRDHLVAFTPTTIQTVHGKHPKEFERVVINSEIGCAQPRTAKGVENTIVFLGHDGVYRLKSVNISQTMGNVEKIDKNIQNIVPYHSEAHAIVSDYQYHLFFPKERKRFRFYYQMGVWTKDESERFNFSDTGSKLNEQITVQDGETGVIYRFDENVWDDDGYVYMDKIETKMFDFGEPYNPKKLKEIQLLMRHFDVRVHTSVFVYADAALVVDPDSSHARVNDDGEVEWVIENDPNLVLEPGTVFGQWELGTSPFGDIDSDVHELGVIGRCRRMKVVLEHKEATPNQLLGFGSIFKLKRP